MSDESANRLTGDWIGEVFTPDDVWQHRVTKVLASCETPFQKLAIFESGLYGKALVLDDRWQTCTGDEFLYHEPIVHAPCILHGSPRRILIAGGADGGAAREALKWKSVEEVLLVDIDSAAIEACRKWLPEIHQGSLDDARVRIEIGDAFEVIGDQRNWDIIIADLTDPIESGPAYKLFTREFFLRCQQALAPGGVFVNQAGSLSPVLIDPLARTVRTIASAFPYGVVMTVNVPTYGSPWGLTMARETRIDPFPIAARTDMLLSKAVNGPLRMFDGQSFLGMMQPAKYVRERINAEKFVYTLESPPGLARS